MFHTVHSDLIQYYTASLVDRKFQVVFADLLVDSKFQVAFSDLLLIENFRSCSPTYFHRVILTTL